MFEEIVEGGITRLVAVVPLEHARAGSARSARPAPPTRPCSASSADRCSRGRAATAASSRAVHGSSLIDIGFDAGHDGLLRATAAAGRRTTCSPTRPALRRARPADAKPPTASSPTAPRARAVAGAPARSAGVRLDFGGRRVGARHLRVRPGQRRLAPAARTAPPTGRGRHGRSRPATSSCSSPRTGPSPADARSPEAQTSAAARPGSSPRARSSAAPGRRDARRPAVTSSTDAPGDADRLTPGQTWIELPSAGDRPSSIATDSEDRPTGCRRGRSFRMRRGSARAPS